MTGTPSEEDLEGLGSVKRYFQVCVEAPCYAMLCMGVGVSVCPPLFV